MFCGLVPFLTLFIAKKWKALNAKRYGDKKKFGFVEVQKEV